MSGTAPGMYATHATHATHATRRTSGFDIIPASSTSTQLVTAHQREKKMDSLLSIGIKQLADKSAPVKHAS